MTFEQAACEVLRRTGKALSPRQIAELAVKHSLLTVIGKRPAETMSARLRVATRPGNTSEVVKMVSGNYGLRDWAGKPPGTGDGFPEPEPPKAEARPAAGADAGDSQHQKKRRPSRGAKRANKEKVPDAKAAPESGGPAKKKRVRKRASARTPDKRTPDRANEERAPSRPAAADGEEKPRRTRRRRGGRKSKGEAEPAEPVRGGARGGLEGVDSEIPLGVDSIHSIVDAAYGLLRGSGGQSPLHFHRIAELGRKKGVNATGYALHAAILADNERRHSQGFRPRFVAGGEGEWGLSEWSVPSALLRVEERLASAVAEMRAFAVRELTARIKAMDARTFQQLAALLLERKGYGNITLVGRSSQGNVALTVTFARAFSASRTSVILRTAGGALGRQHVQDVLKNLPEFGSTVGMVFAPVGVTAEARDAAGEPGDAPISIYDAEAIAEQCVAAGVGVVRQQISTLRADMEFLSRLGLR